MIVIDASALIEVLLQTPPARDVEQRLLASDGAMHVPHLLDVEVAQVIRRLVNAGEVSEARASVAIAALADFPLQRHPHDVFLHRIWELRNNLTAYDASYVALAEALDAPLLTRDRRLASSAGHRGRIDLV